MHGGRFFIALGEFSKLELEIGEADVGVVFVAVGDVTSSISLSISLSLRRKLLTVAEGSGESLLLSLAMEDEC